MGVETPNRCTPAQRKLKFCNRQRANKYKKKCLQEINDGKIKLQKLPWLPKNQ